MDFAHLRALLNCGCHIWGISDEIMGRECAKSNDHGRRLSKVRVRGTENVAFINRMHDLGYLVIMKR